MNEIKKHRLAIVSQIASNFESVPKEDIIAKGEIADSLSYSNSINLSKTGKQIKEGIAKKVVEGRAKKEYLMAEMKNHLEYCKKVPNMPIDNYALKGCKLEYNPKLFTWKEVDGVTDGKVSNSSVEVVEKKLPSEVNHYYEYNKAAKRYISECVDICYLYTIERGLVDKKSYQLTIKQSVLLGL